MGDAGSPVAVLVGLGNPGDKYARTRHNAGFWLVDEVARHYGGSFRMERKFHGEVGRVRVAQRDLLLLKPATFMNHSGRSIAALTGFYRIPPEAVAIAHDEIDLPPGAARLKRGGGHGGHNGLRDTVKALGSREFGRVRIGVGHPGESSQVINYVLSAAGRDEQAAIDRSIEAVGEVIPWLMLGEWDRAFQRLHTQAPPLGAS